MKLIYKIINFQTTVHCFKPLSGDLLCSNFLFIIVYFLLIIVCLLLFIIEPVIQIPFEKILTYP